MGAGRPRTEIGTFGNINVRVLRQDELYEARARFRQRNGRLKDVIRRGKSEPAATRRLKKALSEMADEVAGKAVTGDTKFGRVMDLWLVDLAEKVMQGKRAESTLYNYRSIADKLRPHVAELTCREAENAGLMDEVLKTIRKQASTTTRGKHGEGAQLHARTVLSHACGYAVRHGAMKVNPVKSIESIDREKEEVRALEPEERLDFLAKFAADVQRRAVGKGGSQLGPRARAWTDLPELVAGMLSTGMRIGEALAVTDDAVDLDSRQVHASHHLVRVEGVGIVRKPKRKGDRPGLKVAIVSWTEAMWRRRKMAAAPGGPVFPAWNGQWLDPGNVAKRINKVCVEIGYGWVSSRYFRHTAATHLGDSDLTDTAISDALGNTPDVVRKHYRRPRQSNPAVAEALETMLDE